MSVTNRQQPFAYHAVRISLGLIYFHFGFLKFFPDLSSAELLASQTIVRLTGGLMGHDQALFWLAIMEVTLGVTLMFNVCMRFTFGLFLFHMLGTFSPVILLPELAFKIFPFAPTLEGQYVLKNLVFVAAGWGILAPHIFGLGRNMPESADVFLDHDERATELETKTFGHEAELEPTIIATNAKPILES